MVFNRICTSFFVDKFTSSTYVLCAENLNWNTFLFWAKMVKLRSTSYLILFGFSSFIEFNQPVWWDSRSLIFFHIWVFSNPKHNALWTSDYFSLFVFSVFLCWLVQRRYTRSSNIFVSLQFSSWFFIFSLSNSAFFFLIYNLVKNRLDKHWDIFKIINSQRWLYSVIIGHVIINAKKWLALGH